MFQKFPVMEGVMAFMHTRLTLRNLLFVIMENFTHCHAYLDLFLTKISRSVIGQSNLDFVLQCKV